MVVEAELDLIGVVSPVCLLKCKSGLQGLQPGQVMEVRLRDPEVVDELVRIIARSADEVVARTSEGGVTRIRIRKGVRGAANGQKTDRRKWG